MSDTNVSLGAKTEVKIGQLVEEAEQTLNQNGSDDNNQVVADDTENTSPDSSVGKDSDLGSNQSDNADGDQSIPDEKEKQGNLVKVTDEDILSFLKQKGIELDSTDDVIDRLKPKPSKEEADAVERQKEVERIKLFVDGGGSVEEYNALREAASSKLSDLSLKIEKETLLNNGFSESEVESILSDEYFMSDLDDAYFEDNGYTNEEKEFFLKKQKYFRTKLGKSAEYIQKMAKEELDRLDQERNRINAEKVQQDKYLSKVDSYLNSFPRVKKLEIGKVNDKDVEPIDYQVSDDDLRAVGSVLKNPNKLKQLFFNADGTPKVEEITGYLLAKQTESSKIKTAFFEGGSRQAEVIKNTFGATPYDIGVGNSQRNTQKQAAALGKPIRVPINQQ